MSGRWRTLQQQFVAGLLILVPAWGTVLILLTLFFTLDQLVGKAFGEVAVTNIPGMGLVSLLALIILSGIVATHLRLGQRLLQWAEGWLQRVPVVRSVYLTIKSMTDLFQFRSRFTRSTVVIFPFPRDGLWALGFVMGTAPRPIQVVPATTLMTVFVPTAVHPFTGYLAFIPERNLVPIDLPPEEAMKVEFSAGLYRPATGWLAKPRSAGGPQIGT
jgi:uncharacterized membrane protein